MYNEDELLMLSGIQHFRFCPRQWALIHIEQQWEDNRLTVEGEFLHKNVDSPSYRQKCGDIITLRSVNIASKKLGLYGITDIVELYPSDSAINSITHPKYPGYWQPFPVEYKRGKPKHHEIDEVQLAAQAMCLEEQYGIDIRYGAFFYGETRRREEIEISERLRNIVYDCTESMHDIFRRGKLPQINNTIQCGKCSLKNICMPELSKCSAVTHYLSKNLYEKTT